MDEQEYLYNGSLVSRSVLEEKYGDKTDAKIQEHGMERAYDFKGSVVGESVLKKKYGDDFDSVIAEKGIVPLKKKDQSQQGNLTTSEGSGDGSEVSRPEQTDAIAIDSGMLQQSREALQDPVQDFDFSDKEIPKIGFGEGAVSPATARIQAEEKKQAEVAYRKHIEETPMEVIDEAIVESDRVLSENSQRITEAASQFELLDQELKMMQESLNPESDVYANPTPEVAERYNQLVSQLEQVADEYCDAMNKIEIAAVAEEKALADRRIKREMTGTVSGALKNQHHDAWVSLGVGQHRAGAVVREILKAAPTVITDGPVAAYDQFNKNMEQFEGWVDETKQKSKDSPRSLYSDKTTPEFVEKQSEGFGLVPGALTMSYSLPAMVGGYAGMVVAAQDAAMESIKSSPGADKLDYSEKLAYSAVQGVIAGTLERAGLQSMLGTGTAGKAVSNITNRVIKSLAEKGQPITYNAVQRAAIIMARSGASEGLTEGSQEYVTISMEETMNFLKRSEIFEPNEWNTAIDRIGRSAVMGVNAGIMFGAAPAVFGARRKFDVEGANEVKPTPREMEMAEGILKEGAFADFEAFINSKVKSESLTQEQANEMILDAQGFMEIAEQIDPDNPVEKRIAAFGLLQEKAELQEQVNKYGDTVNPKKVERLEAVDAELKALFGVDQTESKSEPEVGKKEPVEVKDGWSEIIKQASSGKELDAIVDQMDATQDFTPELIDEVAKKRQALETIAEAEVMDEVIAPEQTNVPPGEMLSETQEDIITSLDTMSEEELDALYSEREQAISEQEQTLAEQEYAVFEQTGEASEIALGSVANKIGNGIELSEVEQQIYDSNQDRVHSMIDESYEYQSEEAKAGSREALAGDILTMLPKINYESFVAAHDNIDPSPAFKREYFSKDGKSMDDARDAVQGELDSAGMQESNKRITVQDIVDAINYAAKLEAEGKPYTQKQIEKSVQPKKEGTKDSWREFASKLREESLADGGFGAYPVPGMEQAFKFVMNRVADAIDAAATAAEKYEIFMAELKKTDWYKKLTGKEQIDADNYMRGVSGLPKIQKPKVKEDVELRQSRLKVKRLTEDLNRKNEFGRIVDKEGSVLSEKRVNSMREQLIDAKKSVIVASMRIGKGLPVTGVKEVVAEAKSEIQKKLTEVRKDLRAALNREGTAKSRAEAIESARKGLAEAVKELPKGIKVPARFLKKAAEAKTDKQIEKIVEGLEFYVEKQIRFSKVKQIREQVKKISKKLRQSSTYTNKESRVTELLGLDFSKQSSATLDEVLDVMNQLATRPVAQVRSEQIDALIKKIDRVNDKVETPADPAEIQRKLDLVYDESKSFRSRQTALTRALNILNASRDVMTEAEFEETLEKIEQAQTYLNEQAEQAAIEMNAESEQMLNQVDESDMNQFQKEQVKEMKRVVRMSRETGDNKNYNKAVRLQDIATELAYGYAPMQKMQEYITSLESESISTDGAKRMNNRAGKKKTIKKSRVLTWLTPDVFKRKGVDRKDLDGAVRQLKLENWQFFDDYFGTGKSEWVYVNIIAPFFSKPIVKAYNDSIRDYADGYMKIVDGGLKAVKKTAQKKILMAMMQGNWNVSKDGADYWGKLLQDEKFEKLSRNDRKEIQELYDELPKETVEIDGKQITRVDADGYLNSLTGREKKLYEWLVENNKKYSERQRTANERRGQKYVEEDSRYYFPLFRQDFDFTNDGINDFVSQVVNAADGANAKIKSDRGIARTSGKITPISLDMDNLVREQIFSTNRDLHLSESVKTGLKTVGKLRNKLTDEDAFKYATALHEALKSRIKTEYEQRRSVFGKLTIGKLTMGFYARALISKHRIIVEPIVETVRTATAMPYGQIAKSLQFRATSFTNEGVRKLMDKTGSSFLQDIYLESLAERDRSNMRTGRRGVRKTTNVVKKVAGKLQSFPERMTNNLSWLPSFMLEFERQAGNGFNVREFNNDPDAYMEKHSEAIDKASAFADARTEKLKGAKTRAGQRELIRVAPDFITGGKGAIKAGTDASKLIMVLQNFAFLEQYNVVRNVRESVIYGENKDRTLAAREVIGALISGAMYVWGVSYVIAAFSDDEEEIDKLMSTEGVIESLKSNVAFLAGGRFGNSSKIAALIGTGIYSMVLKKQGTKESKEQLKELSDWTRSRYFSQPFDFGGYKSEADLYGAMLPMVNYLYNDIESSLDNATDLYSIMDKQQRGIPLSAKENETLTMIALVNDLQKTMFMISGTQVPFQRELDKYIREEKKLLKKGTK